MDIGSTVDKVPMKRRIVTDLGLFHHKVQNGYKGLPRIDFTIAFPQIYSLSVFSFIQCLVLSYLVKVIQPISEWLAKMANGRMVKWRDVTISLTACHYIIPIVQYCHLL